jgi:hypothetical protein
VEDDLGIPDRESWLRRSMSPSGKARGWRRQGCIAGLVAGALACLAGVVVALTLGGGEGAEDEPCDQLAIELAYLEAAVPSEETQSFDGALEVQRLQTEIADNRRQQAELGC